CPLRPTVTRLPGRLMAPSTLPSMYNDSEPVTSPWTTRLLPIVAWSAAAGDAGEVLEVRVVVGSWLAAGTDGRVGSVLGDCEGLPGWFGFHISFVLPFVYVWIQAPGTTLRKFFRISGQIRRSCCFPSHLLTRSKPCKPRNPCSSLHLNHAWRKIEIPHSETLKVPGWLTH